MEKDFTLPVRVYYEDTDAAGVVYHANYLKFMERGRSEWLNALGFQLDEVAEKYGVLFTAHRLEIDFIKPARLSNTLSVHTLVRQCRHASLIFFQEIRRQTTTICRATVKIACVDSARLRPKAIPEALLDQVRMHIQPI